MESSDYGSGSSINSCVLQASQDMDMETWLPFHKRAVECPVKPSSSYTELLNRQRLDVMREFAMNGTDAPYNPEDIWRPRPGVPSLSGGSSISYLRQTSWPAPELTPSLSLPRPAASRHSWHDALDFSVFANNVTSTSTPVNDDIPEPTPRAPISALDRVTEEQKRVLTSLPEDVVYALLRQMEDGKRKKNTDGCRFCKNNGERESYVLSHTLKDSRNRVVCPVLRAFYCRRCGATGDNAHTAKYCPFATQEERQKSAAMMRSVRMASGKRRQSGVAGAHAHDDYVMFGAAPRALAADCAAAATLVTPTTATTAHLDRPLDPLWAALEQKLMLY